MAGQEPQASGESPPPRSGRGIRGCLAAARERDPAAAGVSWFTLLATWPGVQAVLAHRVAHRLYRWRIPFLPYLVAWISRSVTGIEIHPGATVGPGVFIDHGSGVVIGETATLGRDVTLYQGVTLGGTGFESGKRHPTVGNNVTIGSGAKLLGPVDVGDNAKIGANTVVIEDVPPNSTVVGNPGHPVRVDGRRPEGPDVDWIHLPDPIQDAITALSARIRELEEQVAALSGQEPPAPTEPGPEPRQGRSPAGG